MTRCVVLPYTRRGDGRGQTGEREVRQWMGEKDGDGDRCRPYRLEQSVGGGGLRSSAERPL